MGQFGLKVASVVEKLNLQLVFGQQIMFNFSSVVKRKDVSILSYFY
jgi:hypothetical protein